MTPEEKITEAVHAVYRQADLRLEALQLDLTDPKDDGTRWTAEDVSAKHAREGFAAIGGAIRNACDVIANAFHAFSTAITGNTKDEYTIAE